MWKYSVSVSHNRNNRQRIPDGDAISPPPITTWGWHNFSLLWTRLVNWWAQIPPGLGTPPYIRPIGAVLPEIPLRLIILICALSGQKSADVTDIDTLHPGIKPPIICLHATRMLLTEPAHIDRPAELLRMGVDGESIIHPTRRTRTWQFVRRHAAPRHRTSSKKSTTIAPLRRGTGMA